MSNNNRVLVYQKSSRRRSEDYLNDRTLKKLLDKVTPPDIDRHLRFCVEAPICIGFTCELLGHLGLVRNTAKQKRDGQIWESTDLMRICVALSVEQERKSHPDPKALSELIAFASREYDCEAHKKDLGLPTNYTNEVQFACYVLRLLGLTKPEHHAWQGTYRLYEIQLGRKEYFIAKARELYDKLRRAEKFVQSQGFKLDHNLPETFEEYMDLFPWIVK